VVVAAEERQQELLAAVRRLEPRHLVRLAGLWAGVSFGTLDARRQHRRNAARLAVRYVTRREDRARTRERSAAAALAVSSVIIGGRNGTELRGPVADAAFAVTDALDAIAHADRLTVDAYQELLRPWLDLMDEIRSSASD
jgi:hypothetical protein